MARRVKKQKSRGGYHPNKVEAKWQKIWEKTRAGQVEESAQKQKAYILDMFPYPSGDGLHVGHPEGYTASDIYARWEKMRGKNVLHPMGFDSFGLPAENAAIKRGIHPRDYTRKNIERFRKQIKSLGFMYDWSREVITSEPEYYKWTQWIFLKLFERGLAYQAEVPINWCPSCKTGLANEEVINGRCERCDTTVEKKKLKQWLLKITAYADRLLNGLDKLDWPESIRLLQKNWIGRSEGAEIEFKIQNSKFKIKDEEIKILLATNNPSKVARIRKLLTKVSPDIVVVTPTEAGLPAMEVEEGGDLFDNARRKAKAYFGQTGLPILGTDTGLFIDGEMIDPVQVKRNALKGQDEKSLNQHQIGLAILDFYLKIVKKHTKGVEAYWKDVFVLIDPDGTERVSESRREVILTNKVHEKIDWHFPLRSIYQVKSTGKYPYDESEAEEYKELQPITDALRKLINQPINQSAITVFTTRPDTIFGATYLVLAPEHPLIKNFEFRISNLEEVKKYTNNAAKKSDLERTDLAKEKTGVELKGIKAINPANNEEIPIWVADYVMTGYGTGAIMAVPAHDERDWEFAKKYQLPIRQVIAPYFTHNPGDKDAVQSDKKTVTRKTAYAFVFDKNKNSFLCLDWEKYGWHSGIIGGVDKGESYQDAALREIREETGYQHLKFVKSIGLEQHNHFFAAHKDENRYAIGQGMLFELIDEEKEPVAAEHAKNHKLVWVNADKMAEWLNLSSFKYMWEAYKSNSDCFTGIGKLMQSGRFDGLDSVEAGKNITSELAKKSLGRPMVQYKLRDWVFSRQRYWGEPIPVVHCEKCKNVKQKVLIIHGFEGSGTMNWMTWMKDELIKRGFEVRVPTMTTSAHPDLNQWLKELRPLVKDFNENDIIIGHSLGSKAALHLLNNSGKKIGHLLLVASAIADLSKRDWTKMQANWLKADIDALQKFWKAPIDLNKITELANQIRIVVSRDDKSIPLYTHNEIPASWNFEIWNGFSHFTAERIPELLEWVLRSKNDGVVPVPEEDLPVKLPELKDFKPTGTGESPLAKVKNWVNVKCPKCGSPAKRETNTMPQWAGSCWYYLRYCDPKNNRDLFIDSPDFHQPEIAATERDHAYFQAFKKIYADLEKQGIRIWAGNRLLLNGLNGKLWLPLRTVAFMTREKDLLSVNRYLVSSGYTKKAAKKWAWQYEKDGIKIEAIPVYGEGDNLVSYTPKNAAQKMKPADLPSAELGRLFDFSYRVVSPKYNLSHYNYINKRESDTRKNLGDDAKIRFLEKWLRRQNKKMLYWQPVDLYVGGAEHAVLHLMYARFWHMVLFDAGLIPTPEPFQKLKNQGLILGEDNQKMSKSRGNVVNPDEMIKKFGADTVRIYEMFMGPFEAVKPWKTNGLIGVKRFLDKVWSVQEKVGASTDSETLRLLHQTIRKVGSDIETFNFNTGVSSLMIFTNRLMAESSISKKDFGSFVKLLSPFAPHLAEELWGRLGEKNSVFNSSWPKFDPELIKEETFDLVVQVNSKVRDRITVPAGISEEQAKTKAMTSEKINTFLNGQEPKKVIYVPGRLINLVVKK
ncbi:MAG: non-canonical purine NTP pyrophosphatase [Patescibacteria group bacterium]|nr:non-canonical purine NTP pyrophosphatase [Patescibacteria group bacterium]